MDFRQLHRDGAEIQGDFSAPNEISLHHYSPILAATFAVRIDDQGTAYEFERLVGDGVLVATPFGSTGYYRSIIGGTFSSGLSVAFNNVHTPIDAPRYIHLSPDADVEVKMLDSNTRRVPYLPATTPRRYTSSGSTNRLQSG
ncbi:hypothetical protein C496_23146 [Natronorubrum tibetense GA33]|uniref:Uncharacterized protein n=1 Tax=Natronorubrum tibetense GA33 TaxID=1114856 RepID=L9VEP8_9EURY|nr:hypothetical protein C496_23146 [Natronorubrum tibetense GA33]